MKHFGLLLLVVLLIAGVTLGYADRRSDKLAEMKAEQLERSGLPTPPNSIAAGWVQLYPDPGPADYRTVQYVAPGVVWIAGFNTATAVDYLWRSYDNAGTWTRIAPPTNKAGAVFAARDSNLVLGATFTGEIIRTTNGGVKWDTTFAYGAGAGFFDGINFIGKDTVVAIGDADASGLLVIRSTNAGATWTRITALPAEELTPDKWFAYATYRKATDVYKTTFWAGLYTGAGTNGRILKSTDAGVTWASWAVPLTGGATNNYRFRSICFVDDSIGFGVDNQIASGSANWLHKTTDGGTTWGDTISVQTGVPHNDARLKTLTAIRGTNVVVGTGFSATTAKAFWSTDKGTSWTASVPPGTDLVGSGFLSATKGFAVGLNNVLQYTIKDVYKVTFNLNTATVPDTIPVTGSTIQIRGGASNAGGFSPITWNNDAQNNMTAVGGDYWKKTVYLQAGDTLGYKYVVAYSTGTGWEQGVVPADFPAQTNANRSFIVPTKDTTLNVEFWNNGANDRAQYFRPWPATPDSFINVYFRVSMAGQIASGTPNFNNDKDTVAVRGGGPVGSDLDWARSAYLVKEAAASNGDGYTVSPATFWSGRLRFPKSVVAERDSFQYKFMIGFDWRGLDELQGQPNRQFKIPVGKKDTTLHFVYYNNEKPGTRANPDTVKVTFIANLATAVAQGGFNAITDTLWVRSGYFQTTATPGTGKIMSRVPPATFTVTDTVITAKGKMLDYQYYVVRNGVEVRENYYNFFYNGATPSEAEKRQILVDAAASKTVAQTVRDTSTSITQARRQPIFANARKLIRNVNVKWEVDLRPAYYQVAWGGDTLTDIQGTFHVRPADKDSIMKWGVWINGPAVGGWNNDGGDWDLGLQNNLLKKMYDNGSNGDRVTNDSIFTRRVLASPDSVNIGTKDRVGQVFKFGIRGGDNEGGKGGFGNNNTANIVDADTIFTISDQFGSINPAFYDAWDYDLHRPKNPTSVIDGNKPLVYELLQNYPNPFNPTTKIEYSIPVQAQVVMKIYNLVGQEVVTLVNEVQKSGIHTVKFSAVNLASGVYFYRLNAGDFTSVKKMVLLK